MNRRNFLGVLGAFAAGFVTAQPQMPLRRDNPVVPTPITPDYDIVFEAGKSTIDNLADGINIEWEYVEIYRSDGEILGTSCIPPNIVLCITSEDDGLHYFPTALDPDNTPEYDQEWEVWES